MRGWPWEEEDPYAYCSAVKLQVGMQYTPTILDGLNKLSETCDTSTDQGLHQLLLDMVLLLQRNEANWRYAHVERALSSSEDEGREAGATLQRWGVEGQSKWGDGQDYSDKNTPQGVTEYVVVTMLVSCYGIVCAGDGDEVKIRNSTDLKKVVTAISGVQVDELIQLDVQWLPEEKGDSMSGLEVTVKFPEMMML
mmetsp:Transcript_65168/g.149308  ORF Transcript_65168/g.149308 Transcript_65168/m.149308 type:complete len:195 (-) Transcript_65168:37-621(-)